MIFAGDSGVGKTSFILHLCKGIFQATVSSTLGIDFHTKNIEVDNTRVTLQLWDTAGQERYEQSAGHISKHHNDVVLLSVYLLYIWFILSLIECSCVNYCH